MRKRILGIISNFKRQNTQLIGDKTTATQKNNEISNENSNLLSNGVSQISSSNQMKATGSQKSQIQGPLFF